MSDASFPEQLLSAFADGQLDGLEKQRVEKLMVDNPQYAEWVNQCRAQSASIRKLPRYHLERDFSDRVLAEINFENPVARASSTCQTAQSPRVWDGRSAGAAILALAAMILLALFVFPARQPGVRGVADNSSLDLPSESPQSKGSKGSNHEVFPIDSNVASHFKRGARLEETENKKLPLKADEWDQESPESSKESVVTDLSNESKSGLANADGISEKQMDRLERDKIPLPMSRAPGELIPGNGNAAVESPVLGLALAPETSELPASNAVPPAADKNSPPIAKVIPAQNVDEVWFVDMKVMNPTEKLQLAFQNNRIQLQTDHRKKTPIEPSASMAAVYVSATNSQMRGAIAMLTDDADILAYSIPDIQNNNAPTNSQNLNSEIETPEFEESQSQADSLSFSSSGSLARHLQEDFNLPKESDRRSKFDRLFFGIVFSAPEPDEVAGKQGGDTEEGKRLAKKKTAPQPGLANGIGQPDEPPGDTDEWVWSENLLKERAENAGRSLNAKTGSRSQRREFASEEMKRFLLLIRFGEESKRADKPPPIVAPSQKTMDNQ